MWAIAEVEDIKPLIFCAAFHPDRFHQRTLPSATHRIGFAESRLMKRE